MKIEKYELILPLLIMIIFTLSVIINNLDWYMYIVSIIIFPLITFFTLRFTFKKMLNDINKEEIKNIIKNSISVKESILSDNYLIETIEYVSGTLIQCFKHDGKVLLCGNGGSAADAQHIAAEFSGKFYFDREPLFAEALHVNTSYLTAVANDYSYDEIYARLVKSMGRKYDILIGFSTSGNSKNIIKAFEVAKSIGMRTIAFTGDNGGELKNISDYIINIPSKDTPRIQESHIMIGHIICEIVEKSLFKK